MIACPSWLFCRIQISLSVAREERLKILVSRLEARCFRWADRGL
jgi:hypothetical protein